MNLTITASEICETARLDPSDAVAAADAAFIIDEDQPSIEAGVEPEAWSLAADHLAILRRAVVKLLAAELIEMRGRAEGASGTFVGAGITISSVPDHAGILRAEGTALLAPYRRRGVIFGPDIATVAVCERPESGAAAQASLFGQTEMRRLGKRRRFQEAEAVA